jgi:hypothetical protein
MRVALVPTGRMEWHGLPSALQRLFPSHSFYALPSKEEVASYPDQFPYDGFTSNTLSEAHATAPPESALELVERAAQEALGDRRRDAADAVFVIDDVELTNAHQPDVVVRVFRRAVEHHLGELQGPIRERTADVLAARVSFHLVVPMIEAWLFADADALSVAGMPADARPSLAASDLEAFETQDPAYRAATRADCPCLPKKDEKKHRPKWLGALPREKHPKGYLQWLCIDGSKKNCTTYDETTNGGEALSRLSWPALLGQPASNLRYLRAFIADLADVLGQQPTTGQVVEDANNPPATSLCRRVQRGNLLRNV